MSKIWWVKQDQLNDSQLEVVANAGKGRGFVLTGPPGSGKTNLLMLVCAAMKTRGFDNAKVIVFTAALREFISAGLATYKLDADVVETLSKASRAIAREHGDKLPVDVSFLELQTAWRERFTSYTASPSKVQRVYDALLIDESQDFNKAEVDVMFGSSGYTVFSIDVNQATYERSDAKHPVLVLQEQNKLPLHFLTIHYRVGRRICKFADLLMDGRLGYQNMEENSMYKEKDRPSLVDYENFNGQSDLEYQKIIGRATNQLAVYPAERIGILFPKNDQLAAFRQYCESNHPGFLENEIFDADGLRAQLFVGTMHEAKGLEFAVVHIAGQEKLSAFATQKTLLFTAATRARYACYITASGKVPLYLTSAYNRLDGPKGVSSSSLFPE